MLNAYEQRLMAFYLANAASALHHRDREASDLAEWIADRENRTAFGSRKRRSPLRAGKVGRDERMSGGKWRALQAALCEEYPVARKARPDRTAQRLRRLAKTTDLTRTDVDVLELVLRYQTQPVIESMIDDVFRSSKRFTPLNVQNPALPALLGVSANTVQGRLRGDAPLVRSGLVCIDSDGDLRALDRLNRLAAAPAGSGLDVHRLLLEAAPASELDWSDFDHVARDRDHIERVIKGALESGAAGVNILLYGPPGTGKTEFCKVLAGRLDVSLYSVGEFDEKGDEPVRGERLQELRLAQRLLAGHGRSLLLFDEMEDLLMDPFPAWGLFGPRSRMAFRNTGSKVYMHRLLEAAPTPTLWTMNSTRAVSETILRRMMFALELRRPTPRVRARIWARELARRGIEAPSEDVLCLVRTPAARRRHGPCRLDARGLRGRAPEGVVPLETRRARSTRGHASRRVRREAGPPPPDRVPAVRARGSAGFRPLGGSVNAEATFPGTVERPWSGDYSMTPDTADANTIGRSPGGGHERAAGDPGRNPHYRKRALPAALADRRSPAPPGHPQEDPEPSPLRERVPVNPRVSPGHPTRSPPPEVPTPTCRRSRASDR